MHFFPKKRKFGELVGTIEHKHHSIIDKLHFIVGSHKS